MSVFVLEGSDIDDATALKSDPVLSTMRTIDDSKTSTNTLWTSEKVLGVIESSFLLSAAGFLSIPLCRENMWTTFAFGSWTPFSNSLIALNKSTLIIPQTGTYKFTLCVSEKIKTKQSFFCIKLKQDPDKILFVNKPNGQNACPCQMQVVLKVQANDQVEFKFFQTEGCSTFMFMNWAMQQLNK